MYRFSVLATLTAYLEVAAINASSVMAPDLINRVKAFAASSLSTCLGYAAYQGAKPSGSPEPEGDIFFLSLLSFFFVVVAVVVAVAVCVVASKSGL